MSNIEAEVKAVVMEAVTEVEKVVAPLFPEAKKLRIDLEDAEKLAIREVEVQYLRATSDAQRVAQAMEQLKNRYMTLLKKYTDKYAENGEYVWDELEAAFKAVAKKL